jgi:hypothetical protein
MGSSGATLNGKPTVCGGWVGGTNWPANRFQTTKCYKFASNTWSESGQMTRNRTWPGFDYSQAWGLVMAGGHTVSNLFEEMSGLSI